MSCHHWQNLDCMGTPLKDQFGVDIPVTIATMITRVFPPFRRDLFVNDALDGYASLDLMARGWKIAGALRDHLPASYPEAVDILIASLAPTPDRGQGMAPFLYLPHSCFIAEYGLEYFEISMRAQYELTQRFTAEFSIRPYLERHTEATLARLREWAYDPSPHVRRLVSEGTRPRLPWAPRLREFQRDPRPVLALLEALKDDPAPSVRRSVANNLNDIGKDHSHLLVETARRWMIDATDERRRLVRHALRSAVKRADPGALEVMGFGKKVDAMVGDVQITPRHPVIGGSVGITFDITSTGSRRQRILVDFRIHYVKASGKTRPKVFKARTVDLAPGETVRIGKTVSLADMTTRRHYAGTHGVDVMLNGSRGPLYLFELADD